MKKIKNYIIDMISDTSGHINSKIVLGVISFIVAIILALLKYDYIYVGMFLSFSAGSLGFSCFDNNSAFKFQRTETSTETINTTKTTDVNIDGAKIVENFKKKRKK